METTKTTPQAYIDSLPGDRQDAIQTLHDKIVKIFKGQTVQMWEGIFWGGSEQKIIGYGDCVYINSKKQEVKWFVVGLTYQKNYISIYVVAVEDKEYVVEKYKAELGKAKTGKSVVSFKNLEDVNVDVLMKIIKKAKEINDQK